MSNVESTQHGTLCRKYIGFQHAKYTLNESMVSLVLRQYMRGENGTESLVGFFFKCRSAMALWSVLLIRIGKQNVKIIEKISRN